MRTFDDLQSYLIMKSSQGIPLETLIKMAAISVNQHFIAAERWVQTEGGDTPSAPLWLEEREARILVGALKGQRGVTARCLRRSLKAMFEVEEVEDGEEESDATADPAGDGDS